MRRFVKYFSALALSIYSLYFVSLNLFPHVHETENGRVIHSHPYSNKSHSHSTLEYQLLTLISATIYLSSSSLSSSSCTAVAEEEIEIPAAFERVRSVIYHIIGLRAPPVLV